MGSRYRKAQALDSFSQVQSCDEQYICRTAATIIVSLPCRLLLKNTAVELYFYRWPFATDSLARVHKYSIVQAAEVSAGETTERNDLVWQLTIKMEYNAVVQIV